MSRVRTTGDHPRATTTGHACARPDRTGPADRQEPPCPEPASLPPTHSVGTQRSRPTRLAAGLALLDRAWPIVVHSRPGHKRVRYSLVMPPRRATTCRRRAATQGGPGSADERG
ncbi:hypothetical protein DNK56_25975 [Streptomyces sp. AC1-42W]|nr:hypothetical protein DNK56_25975 [Streptomyces sp. AC1-42W]PZT79302.1 hypothetical protein DNK55_06705 [Streptomyces sp. AC1-42T]